MKKEKKYYLTCEVCEMLKANFSNEKYVEFKDINGNTICGIWPNSKIRQNKLEISLRNLERDKALIFGPFPDSGGYGFFQGSSFYVNPNLISEAIE